MTDREEGSEQYMAEWHKWFDSRLSIVVHFVLYDEEETEFASYYSDCIFLVWFVI